MLESKTEQENEVSVNRNRYRWISVLFVAAIVSVLASCAAGPRERDRPQKPPSEAIEACADLSAGDACSFTGPRNEAISGTCMALKGDQEQLACTPEGGPPGKKRRPRR